MNNSASKSKFDASSLVYLSIGRLFLFFFSGKWVIPLATWIAPIFLMRFSRTQKPLTGFVALTIIFSIVSIIVYQNLLPFQGAPFYIMMSMGGLFSALLYLADRLLAKRINGFSSTLIFPLASVALEFLHVSTSPMGANGSIVLDQTSLPLLQLISITGIYGVLFLMTWTASVVNWAWERKFNLPELRLGAWLYLGILIAVFLFGSIRLSLFPPKSETIRIASVASGKLDPDIPPKGESWETFRIQSAEEQEILLNLSKRATCSGAQILVWPEGEIFILQEDEQAFIQKGIQLAKSENIFLGMSIAVFTKNFPSELAINKIVWIDTTGNILFEYLKALPVPGEKCIAGDGKPKILNFSNSKIASTICFDLDHPAFIRKFGQADVDIMISPANDHSQMHTHWTLFRTLEQGFSLVRPNTKRGLAVAQDYQGRMLSSVDYTRTKNEIMISDLPIKGVTTIYAIIGDLFAWLCSFGFVITVLWTVFKRKKV